MLVMGISDKCNFNCRFCLDKNLKGKGEPALNEIKKMFVEAKRVGEDTVMFMRGESLIRPDFLKILRSAADFGLKTCITTNGSYLNDYETLDLIIKNGVSRINISIHSHNNKTAEKISGVKKCKDLQEAALKNIDLYNSRTKKQLRVPLRINTVICRLNYKELKHFVTYIKKLLPHTEFSIKFKCMIIDTNNLKQFKNITVPFLEIKPHLLKAMGKLSKKQIATSGFPLCVTPGYEWACVELQEWLRKKNKYIYPGTIKTIRQTDPIFLEQFFKYAECEKCALNDICMGVRSDYRKIHPRFNLKISRSKTVKNIKNKIIDGFHLPKTR